MPFLLEKCNFYYLFIPSCTATAQWAVLNKPKTAPLRVPFDVCARGGFIQNPRCFLLFVHAFLYCNCTSNGCANHRIVTHTDKSHHFDVSGNGAAPCELCVAVHTSHRIGHAVRRGACRHVIGVQGTSRAAARRNGEVFLPLSQHHFCKCLQRDVGNGWGWCCCR